VRIFEAHKPAVLAALREASTSDEPHISVSDLGAMIEIQKDKPDSVKARSRGELATYLEEYRGLLRPLLARPVGNHTFVAIAAKGVLSLHLAEVIGFETQRFELVMVKREVAFEPSAIKNRSVDSLHVTAWRAPDGERRYAWTVGPDEPATDDEAIDRYITRDGAKLREAAAEFAASHPGKWPVGFAMCMRQYGDAMEVIERADFAPMGEQFPKIAHAIAATNDPALLPVVVLLGLSAGLRWLQLTKDDRALPPSLFEVADVPADEHAIPFFDIPAPPPKPARPKKPNPPATPEHLLEDMRVDYEIDVHLSQMTKDDIDADMRRAGFDLVEHATRWIRKEVIAAMSELERDESRFWGEDGHFRTRPKKK
jgi:hypothetical protein